MRNRAPKSQVPGLEAEAGFALVTSIGMMLAAFALAMAAAVVAISGQEGATRDKSSKAAFAGAEAGLADAILRFNFSAPGAPCAPVTAAGPDGAGWCGPVDIASGPNGGAVRYWVNPPGGTVSSRCAGTSSSAACMEVVAMGTLGGASRRIDATATSANNQPLFADAAVKAQDYIHMDSNATVQSGVATNGDITLSANAKQCGPASVGVGHALTLTSNAAYYGLTNCTQPTTAYAQQALTLPPINQGDAPANNNNSRLFGLDPVSGNKADVCFNGRKADGSTGSCGARELSISGNSSLTIGGSIYSLCKLTMSSNSKLYTAANSNVKIYFDSPEACGQPADTTQMQLDSNTRISAATASSIALLFVGSPSLATRIQLNSNTAAGAQCQQNFVIYAPLSQITFNSNSAYCGAIGGKSLTLNSYANVTSGAGVSGFVLPNTSSYYVLDAAGYVECAAAAATPKNGGC